MTNKKEALTERRNFLKMAALSAPAAAIAAGSVAVDEASAASTDSSSDRLQDTAHTRAFYDSARF
ncbi:MAG: twin-arginine translocation signal domain-containing protein [Desulfobulbia bacterium]